MIRYVWLGVLLGCAASVPTPAMKSAPYEAVTSYCASAVPCEIWLLEEACIEDLTALLEHRPEINRGACFTLMSECLPCSRSCLAQWFVDEFVFIGVGRSI